MSSHTIHFTYVMVMVGVRPVSSRLWMPAGLEGPRVWQVPLNLHPCFTLNGVLAGAHE